MTPYCLAFQGEDVSMGIWLAAVRKHIVEVSMRQIEGGNALFFPRCELANYNLASFDRVQPFSAAIIARQT